MYTGDRQLVQAKPQFTAGLRRLRAVDRRSTGTVRAGVDNPDVGALSGYRVQSWRELADYDLVKETGPYLGVRRRSRLASM